MATDSGVLGNYCEKWRTPKEEHRNGEVYIGNVNGELGLCVSALSLPQREIDFVLERIMKVKKLDAALPMFKWPLTYNGAYSRVAFCLREANIGWAKIGQQWLDMAETWEAGNTYIQYSHTYSKDKRLGLCSQISASGLSVLNKDVMREALADLLDYKEQMFKWPLDEDGALSRHLFCKGEARKLGIGT